MAGALRKGLPVFDIARKSSLPAVEVDCGDAEIPSRSSATVICIAVVVLPGAAFLIAEDDRMGACGGVCHLNRRNGHIHRRPPGDLRKSAGAGSLV